MPERRHARMVADDPDEVTRTTWAAVVPDGTAQVEMAGRGGGVGAAGAGVAVVVGLCVALVGDGLGEALVEVVAGGGAVVEEEAEAEADGGRVAAATSLPPEQAARRSRVSAAGADRPGRGHRRSPRRVAALIARSAGSPGGSTTRPT